MNSWELDGILNETHGSYLLETHLQHLHLWCLFSSKSQCNKRQRDIWRKRKPANKKGGYGHPHQQTLQTSHLWLQFWGRSHQECKECYACQQPRGWKAPPLKDLQDPHMLHPVARLEHLHIPKVPPESSPQSSPTAPWWVWFSISYTWSTELWKSQLSLMTPVCVCISTLKKKASRSSFSQSTLKKTTDHTHGFQILNMNAWESNFLWILQIWGKNQQIELNAWSIFFWSNACCSGFIMFMLLYSGISFTWEHVWEEDLSLKPLHWRQCLSLLVGLWLQLQLCPCYHLCHLPRILLELVEEPQEEPHRRQQLHTCSLLQVFWKLRELLLDQVHLHVMGA